MRIFLLIAVAIGIVFFIALKHTGPARVDWAAAQRSGDLVDAYDKSVPKDRWPAKPYTFIYFSAGWCPPCHAFTPQLVDFYNAAGKARNFNLIMISEDKDQDGLTGYAEEFNMPWIFARQHSSLWHLLFKKYANSGIPDLVLLDKAGNVLSDSFSGSDYLGPAHVLEDYRKL